MYAIINSEHKIKNLFIGKLEWSPQPILESDTVLEAPDSFVYPGERYNDIRMWTPEFVLRDANELIVEGFLVLAENEKVEDGKIVFLTEEELVLKGLLPMEPYVLRLKVQKEEELLSGFEKEFEEGHFMSATLGIEVDCRRVGIKNDIQNVDGLILDYDNLSVMEKHYVGYTETTSFPLTFTQLNSLKLEMVQWGKSQYNKKWILLDQASKATTIEQIKIIKW